MTRAARVQAFCYGALATALLLAAVFAIWARKPAGAPPTGLSQLNSSSELDSQPDKPKNQVLAHGGTDDTDEPASAGPASRPEEGAQSAEASAASDENAGSKASAPTDEDASDKAQTTSAVGLAGGTSGNRGVRKSQPPYRPKEGTDAHSVMEGSLAWLAAHQNSGGQWSPQEFDDVSKRRRKAGIQITRNIEFIAPRIPFGDKGVAESELMATALALTAFSGVGYTHKEGEHRFTVRSAVLHLRKVQRSDGLFGGSRELRDHALATIAMIQAYGVTSDAVLKPIVDKALEYLLNRRVPGSGWGRSVDATDEENEADEAPNLLDTFYAVRAIRSAQQAGLEIDATEAMADAAQFLAPLHRGGGRVWYTETEVDAPRSLVEGCTRGPINEAAWVAAMLLSGGRAATDADIVEVSQRIVQAGAFPHWAERGVDYEHWWIGTLACSLASGGPSEGVSVWDAWGPAVRGVLVPNQRGTHHLDQAAGLTSPELLDEHGSWDAVSPWSNGGRVESTAFAALTLQIYYRYQSQVLKKD